MSFLDAFALLRRRDRRTARALTKRRRLAPDLLEGRLMPAYLSVWIGGGAVAVANAGPRSDSEVTGLGDADVTKIPLSQASYSPTNARSYASASLAWSNSSNLKTFFMRGDAESASGNVGDAPGADISFGSAKFTQVADLGNLIDLVILPDAGESNGQAIDVTITDYVTATSDAYGGGNGGTSTYQVRYASEKAGPFVSTLDSGSFSGSGSSTRTVVIHTEIGKIISIGAKGGLSVGATSNSVTNAGSLQIQVSAELGLPSPPPQVSTSTSLPEIVTVQRKKLATNSYRFLLNFATNRPAPNPADALNRANYRVSLAGKDGVFGTADDQIVRIKNIKYKASGPTVTLYANYKPKKNQAVRIDIYNYVVTGHQWAIFRS